jgi:hypothetical protein
MYYIAMVVDGSIVHKVKEWVDVGGTETLHARRPATRHPRTGEERYPVTLLFKYLNELAGWVGVTPAIRLGLSVHGRGCNSLLQFCCTSATTPRARRC